MSFTYSQPPGRTRQQRVKKPMQKQPWNNEEQDMDTGGASAWPSEYPHHSKRSSNPSTRSTSREYTPQHESSQQQPIQHHGSYYVKAPNAAKRATTTKIIHEEEVEYNAYQAKKRTHLSNELSQMSPTKLGGRRLDDDDIATMREKQERQARLDKKFDSIRKREKREHYIAEQRQRDNQVYEAKKQKAREQADRLEEKKRAEGEAQREETRR